MTGLEPPTLRRVAPRSDPSADSAGALLSLEGLFDAHQQVALGLAWRIVQSRQDAEEVVQEAFLSVWRSRSTFDLARGSTRTWVLAAVRNRALDVLRARKRRPLSECLHLERVAAAADVATTATASADRETVLYALALVPADQREALELAYSGGFTHTEIADILRVPVGTVKGRIRLGLDHLRQALLDETTSWAA